MGTDSRICQFRAGISCCVCCLMLQYFVRSCNQKLADMGSAEAADLAALPLQQRLHTLLRWRLQMIHPFIGESDDTSGARPAHDGALTHVCCIAIRTPCRTSLIGGFCRQLAGGAGVTGRTSRSTYLLGASERAHR